MNLHGVYAVYCAAHPMKRFSFRYVKVYMNYENVYISAVALMREEGISAGEAPGRNLQ
jgi:hypothetical protein